MGKLRMIEWKVGLSGCCLFIYLSIDACVTSKPSKPIIVDYKDYSGCNNNVQQYKKFLNNLKEKTKKIENEEKTEGN